MSLTIFFSESVPTNRTGLVVVIRAETGRNIVGVDHRDVAAVHTSGGWSRKGLKSEETRCLTAGYAYAPIQLTSKVKNGQSNIDSRAADEKEGIWRRTHKKKGASLYEAIEENQSVNIRRISRNRAE